MKEFNFIKISDRWFVDVPYNGSVSDLEMVDGADTFLECYADGTNVVNLLVIEDEKDYNDPRYLYNLIGMSVVLKKKAQNWLGTTYEVSEGKYRGDVWLCPVFNLLMGESPEKLYVVVTSPNIKW